MKVLHLCTYPKGGAANAALRLHHALHLKGIESIFGVKSDIDSPLEYRVATNSRWTRWYANNAPRIEFHLAKWIWPRTKPVLTANLLPGVCRSLISSVNPDIVHLHWVEHNLVTISDLKWLNDSGRPIVWTLHDLSPISGGVGFRETFDLSPEPFGPLACQDSRRKVSEHLLKRRTDALDRAALQVVAPSRWLAEEARRSPVSKRHKVHHVPNGIDFTLFQPSDRTESRARWELPMDRPIILFGADAFDDERKGFQHLLAACSNLKNRTGKSSPLLVAFGNKEPIDTSDFPIDVLGVGRVWDERSLASLYGAADLFICPSREDNLPNTVIESLACGTPVAGFRIGGLPDLILDGQTGFLADPYDDVALGAAISLLVSLEEDQQAAMRNRCRAHIVENFSSAHQAETYTKIYDELLQGT